MTSRARLVFLVAIVAAAVGLTAVALAQQPTVTLVAKLTAKGGTKAKPKPAGLHLAYAGVDPGGSQLLPPKAFTLFVGRSRISPSIVRACTAAAMNLAKSNVGCRAATKLGTGTIDMLLGSARTPATDSVDCQGVLAVYGAGRGHAALWVQASPDTGCPAVINEAVDVFVARRRGGVQLQFTIPDDLRHFAAVDASVIGLTADIATIVKVRGKAKKRVGYLESVCGKSKRRTSTVTVLDEAGASSTSSSTGAC
jgi:hypothetical protein